MQQRDIAKLISRLSWDDLKFVLAAAELGSNASWAAGDVADRAGSTREAE